MYLDQPFLINHRFLIDPSRHTILDLKTQSELRVELRHVKLLCLLCDHNGKPVGRDVLIREIWNDYSGAEEALTQGISILRKLLTDEKKELIKTIPKKGYIFGAQLSYQSQILTAHSQPTGKKKVAGWVYGMLAVVGLGILLIFMRPYLLEQEVKQENGEGKKFEYIPASTGEEVETDKHPSASQ